MHVTCVTVDRHDPAAAARFRSEALLWGGVTVGESGNGATCHLPSGGTYLEFVRVPEVQMWVDEPSTNFGWVVLGTEGSRKTAKRFDSKDHDTEANWPTLTVTFAEPLDLNDGP